MVSTGRKLTNLRQKYRILQKRLFFTFDFIKGADWCELVLKTLHFAGSRAGNIRCICSFTFNGRLMVLKSVRRLSSFSLLA